MANNSGIVARCSCKGTAVADLLLDVADNRTFGALGNGKNVAYGEGGLLAAVDEGSCMEAF